MLFSTLLFPGGDGLPWSPARTLWNGPHVHEFMSPLWVIIWPLEAPVTGLFRNDFLWCARHWLQAYYVYFTTTAKSITNKSSNNTHTSQMANSSIFPKIIYILICRQWCSPHSVLFYLLSSNSLLFLLDSNLMNISLFPYSSSYLVLIF